MWNEKPPIKIPPEVLQETMDKLDEILEMLLPHLGILKPDDRFLFKKADSGLMNFFERIYDLVVNTPQLFPSFAKTEIFREEYSCVNSLWMLDNKINHLLEYVIDAEMLAESRTLEIAAAFYKTVKKDARRDIPCARIIFDELKTSFPVNAKARKKTPEETDRQLKLFGD